MGLIGHLIESWPPNNAWAVTKKAANDKPLTLTAFFFVFLELCTTMIKQYYLGGCDGRVAFRSRIKIPRNLAKYRRLKSVCIGNILYRKDALKRTQKCACSNMPGDLRIHYYIIQTQITVITVKERDRVIMNA